ncbi:MAG: hypothetical protein ACNYPE_12610 [Candidatus Azotimanducaceae bacterium WSBS_2022_MAG_OTU7]
MLLSIPIMLGNFYQGTTFAQVQGLAPVRTRRAVAAAVLLLIAFVFAHRQWPLSDMFAGTFNDDALRYSLLAWGFVNLWAAFTFGGQGLTLPVISPVGSK